jgi:hypothetical protein
MPVSRTDAEMDVRLKMLKGLQGYNVTRLKKRYGRSRLQLCNNVTFLTIGRAINSARDYYFADVSTQETHGRLHPH